MPYAFPESRPIVLEKSKLAQVYLLLGLAMALTVVGVFAGVTFALPLLSSGMGIVLLLLELGIVLTARLWMHATPLNYVLFGLFPLLSGLTITPFLLAVAVGYANGAAILINAAIACALLTGASAVFAYTTSWNLSGMLGRFLFQTLIGLIIFGLLQLFLPSLRGPGFEMILSGVGIVTFSLFLAVDIQRTQHLSAYGQSPFLLALSLYLDIFNLFLYIVRFMLASSGRRR